MSQYNVTWDYVVLADSESEAHGRFLEYLKDDCVRFNDTSEFNFHRREDGAPMPDLAKLRAAAEGRPDEDALTRIEALEALVAALEGELVRARTTTGKKSA